MDTMLTHVKISWGKGLLVFFLFAIGTSAYSQPRGGQKSLDAPTRAKQQTERMKKELQLTETQLPEVEAVNLKYSERQQALFSEKKEGEQPDRSKMRSEMEKLEQEKEADLKPLLTESQWKTYQANKKSMNRGARPKGEKKDTEGTR
jgi:hypothetical protein